MAKRINFKDLSPEVQQMLRDTGQIPTGGWHRKLTAQLKRKYAIKCLATMADLTQDHRRRVLDFAAKINEV